MPEDGISLKCVCSVWESISPFACLCHLEPEAVPGCQSARSCFPYLSDGDVPLFEVIVVNLPELLICH